MTPLALLLSAEYFSMEHINSAAEDTSVGSLRVLSENCPTVFPAHPMALSWSLSHVYVV